MMPRQQCQHSRVLPSHGRCCRQRAMVRTAEQHGHVRVVAAGMHLARMRALILDVHVFLP